MSIELRHVSKRFGGVTAVEDVSFTVADGELVALLGPSGGGKTTVLRMIAGLEVPTSGDLLVRGERVNEVPVQKRNIGFVFQSYALFKTMSVADNIGFGLKIRKVPRVEIEARVEELLRLFGLEGLGRRLPHQLSGGQRQRVAIARMLRQEPVLLLADEPLASLDPRLAADLLQLLLALAEPPKALLLSLHRPDLLAGFDRVIGLRQGRVLFDRAVAEVGAELLAELYRGSGP